MTLLRRRKSNAPATISASQAGLLPLAGSRASAHPPLCAEEDAGAAGWLPALAGGIPGAASAEVSMLALSAVSASGTEVPASLASEPAPPSRDDAMIAVALGVPQPVGPS